MIDTEILQQITDAQPRLEVLPNRDKGLARIYFDLPVVEAKKLMNILESWSSK